MGPYAITTSSGSSGRARIARSARSGLRLLAAVAVLLVAVFAVAAAAPAKSTRATVADTLGRTTVGALTHTLGGGYLEVSGPYAAWHGSVGEQADRYLRGGGLATPMRAVIYSDSGGKPGSFVAVSLPVTVAGGQAAGWVDFPVTGSPTLPAGTYWLGYWSQNTSAQGFYDTVAGGGRYAPAGYSATANPPASWPGGGAGDSLAYSLYATLAASGAPVNTSLPTIPGTASPFGHVTVDPGSWTNNPTGFSYQEQLCDDSGQNCADHGAAQSDPTFYVWEAARSLRVVVTATNGSGSSNATTAVKYVAPWSLADPFPLDFFGYPVEGQTYTYPSGIDGPDSWFGARPFSFALQWQRCDGDRPLQLTCSPIAGADAISYVPVAADVGHLLRLMVTATNAGGSSSAYGVPTYGVQAALPTCGKMSVGALTHALGGGYLEVSRVCTLAQPASVSKLTGYLRGGGLATPMRAVIYSDSGGKPGSFVAVSQPVTVAAGQAAGWVDFPVSGSPTLPAGVYWLGLWSANTSAQGYYDTVAGGGAYAPAGYSATASPPAGWPGGGAGDSLAYSIYATLCCAQRRAGEHEFADDSWDGEPLSGT